MGFGSYDESEQERQELDSGNVDDDASVKSENHAHKGEVDFEIGASNDELLDRLKDIKQE